MAPPLDMPLFLATVVFISLSGVMMPGPVTAVTIAKGRTSGRSGALVALGHGVVEVPLMALIYFGLTPLFAQEAFRRVIGLVGGIMLGFMGFQMFRERDVAPCKERETGISSVFSGVVTTGGNPYFFLWWATIGSSLLANSTIFGLTGFILFGLVHWSCDFFWYLFISKTVFKSRTLWTPTVQRTIFTICASILIIFGSWFIYTSVKPA